MSASLLKAWRDLAWWRRLLVAVTILAGLTVGLRLALFLCGRRGPEISREDVAAFVASQPELVALCSDVALGTEPFLFEVYGDFRDWNDFVTDWDAWMPRTYVNARWPRRDGTCHLVVVSFHTLGPWRRVTQAWHGKGWSTGCEAPQDRLNRDTLTQAAQAWFVDGKRPDPPP